MKIYPFLNLKYSNLPIETQLKTAACEVIESGWYINGPKVTSFETKLATLCETKYAIGVSNGLDALRLILRAYIEIGEMCEGDEIIVPANTYIASILAITDCKLKPIFVEPSSLTLNLDSSLIEKAITPRTKAIMVVHLYGSPCWDNSIVKIAESYNLKIIEDNAQAIGATASTKGLFNTYITGGLGHAAGNSFYPTKNLGALGDAGAVTTNDECLANAVRALSNYGSNKRYHNIYAGVNCRLDEMQAAFLLIKLDYLQTENNRRAKLAKVYDNHICNSIITKPFVNNAEKQVWHQYVLRAYSRDSFREYLHENGVETDIIYPTPPHLQPCYYKIYGKLKLPITERICNTVVSIPISSQITETDAFEISEIINNYR